MCSSLFELAALLLSLTSSTSQCHFNIVTVMVATVHSRPARIIQSYLPGVAHYVCPPCNGFLDQRESTTQAALRSFPPFLQTAGFHRMTCADKRTETTLCRDMRTNCRACLKTTGQTQDTRNRGAFIAELCEFWCPVVRPVVSCGFQTCRESLTGWANDQQLEF